MTVAGSAAPDHRLSNTPSRGEAVQALTCQLRGFGQEFEDGWFQINIREVETALSFNLFASLDHGFLTPGTLLRF